MARSSSATGPTPTWARATSACRSCRAMRRSASSHCTAYDENAFDEPSVKLLTTLASSMSVALQNARLFDETQSLLKETEQRNAELAVINSIQEGMAAELDFQAHRRPGRRQAARSVRHRRHRHPLVRPEGRTSIHYLYEYEHGVRLNYPVGAASARRHLLPRCCGNASAAGHQRTRWPSGGASDIETRCRAPTPACRRSTSRSSAAIARCGVDRPRELRARECVRRIRRAAAQHGRRAAWASRSRTRACSTKRSAC